MNRGSRLFAGVETARRRFPGSQLFALIRFRSSWLADSGPTQLGTATRPAVKGTLKVLPNTRIIH
jgi:hypothetical protein